MLEWGKCAEKLRLGGGGNHTDTKSYRHKIGFGDLGGVNHTDPKLYRPRIRLLFTPPNCQVRFGVCMIRGLYNLPPPPQIAKSDLPWNSLKCSMVTHKRPFYREVNNLVHLFGQGRVEKCPIQIQSISSPWKIHFFIFWRGGLHPLYLHNGKSLDFRKKILLPVQMVCILEREQYWKKSRMLLWP